jgi:hypothetical protein
MGWFDDIKKKLATGAAEKAADEALNSLADDMEKHLVGDMAIVEEHDRKLAERAAAEDARMAARVKEVHAQRMGAEDKARAELDKLKALRAAKTESANPDDGGKKKTL